MNNPSVSARFLRSALQPEGACISNAQVLSWIAQRNHEVQIQIEPIKLSQMRDWFFDKESGRIRHVSGKFFSIDGIDVRSDYGNIHEWRQPIINQPEIGFLGCIVKEINGILHFLIQAKIEPGNVNCVQLSPTLQATKSNYTQVHKGKRPRYLEYFNGEKPHRVLIDQLQSEQGARFLHKRNRNIIVEIEEDIPPHPDFVWLTLGQIKSLLFYDNIINMDLRTVISGISFGELDRNAIDCLEILTSCTEYTAGMLSSALDTERPLYSFEEIISWFTSQKVKYTLDVKPVDLREIPDWVITDEGLHHKDQLFFDVRYVNVLISNREVSEWQQPLVAPKEEGILAFIVKKINGIYHFLVQAKLECGNLDVLEFAPTIQCITGSYRNSRKILPYLDYVLSVRKDQIRLDVMQSEEGGRFYHEQNRNLIIEADDDFPVECPENFCWMTLHQLLRFVRFNNFLNIQTRSLLSAISLLDQK